MQNSSTGTDSGKLNASHHASGTLDFSGQTIFVKIG
jgi:hypothetical protein